jgi:hypothetical protein
MRLKYLFSSDIIPAPEASPINKKNLPKKSQGTFYNFAMISVMPQVLNAWHKNKGREKYFLDKGGMSRWYTHKLREAVYKLDWVSVIMLAIILLYRREKVDEYIKRD